MPDTPRFERDPAEGSRSTVERQLEQDKAPIASEEEARPDESFPPFDDPGGSPERAGAPVKPEAPAQTPPPKDTQYAGHPDFSQNAANNSRPSSGMGNSEPLNDFNETTRHSEGQSPPFEGSPSPPTEQISGAAPAIAERSKDARAAVPNRQPGAYVEDDPLPEAPDEGTET
jgi:hypothetical protein